MKMDLGNRAIVNMAFCFGNQSVDRKYIFFYSFRYLQIAYNRFNFRKRRMMVLMMGMLRCVLMVRVLPCVLMMGMFLYLFLLVLLFLQQVGFLDAVYGHGHVRSRYAALLHSLFLINDVRNPDGVELFHKSIGIGQKFQKRSGQHVPRSAHAAVQIQ